MYKKWRKTNCVQLKTALRKAIVGAQHSIDRLHRTELFRSEERSIENEQGKSAGIRRRGKMEKESLVRHSASVTDSLLGISRAMNDQVRGLITERAALTYFPYSKVFFILFNISLSWLQLWERMS